MSLPMALPTSSSYGSYTQSQKPNNKLQGVHVQGLHYFLIYEASNKNISKPGIHDANIYDRKRTNQSIQRSQHLFKRCVVQPQQKERFRNKSKPFLVELPGVEDKPQTSVYQCFNWCFFFG